MVSFIHGKPILVIFMPRFSEFSIDVETYCSSNSVIRILLVHFGFVYVFHHFLAMAIGFVEILRVIGFIRVR